MEDKCIIIKKLAALNRLFFKITSGLSGDSVGINSFVLCIVKIHVGKEIADKKLF